MNMPTLAPGEVRDLVFASAVLPGKARGPEASLNVQQQTECALRHIDRILQASGTDLDRLVRLTVYTTDMDHWADIDAAVARVVGVHFSARAVVAVSWIHYGYRVALDAIAAA